jgi:hypothetical protein
VLFAVADVCAHTAATTPAGTERPPGITTGVFAAGAIALFFASKRYPSAAGPAALVFDALVIAAYATIYSFEYGSPTRWAFIFVILEAALVYGVVGGDRHHGGALPVSRLRRVVASGSFRRARLSVGPRSWCRSACLRFPASSSGG